MKRLLFFTFLCIFSFGSFAKTVKAESTAQILTKIVGMLAGDDGAEMIAKKLFDCDDWEDSSITTAIQSLFTTSAKKTYCNVSNTFSSIATIVGFGTGGILGGLAANVVSQAYTLLTVWLKHEDAKKKAETYHLCFDTQEEGHPLPYTDKQIAKALKLANKTVSVENIIKQYDKLCLYDDHGRYGFYGFGDEVDGVFIEHADGYSYVICASILNACPCIYNIQHGTLKEPEYEYEDEEKTVIKMVDGELQMKDAEKYKQRYAKHCRIIRYQDLFEQTNDLSNIMDPACQDLRGYAKANLSMSGAITQCMEGTARNIFEKPIFKIERFIHEAEDITQEYAKDLATINTSIGEIKKIIGSRTLNSIEKNQHPSLNASEKNKIIKLMTAVLYNKNSNRLRYDCSKPTVGDAYEFTSDKASLYDKYNDVENRAPNVYCCSMEDRSSGSGTIQVGGVDVCFKNVVSNTYKIYDGILPSSDVFLLPSISQSGNNLDDKTIFAMFDGLKQFQKEISSFNEQANNALYAVFNDTTKTSWGAKFSLFDLFRNNVKMIAIFFITVWIVMFGWKAVSGSLKFEASQIVTMFIPFFLVCFITFSDRTKNTMFELIIKVSQGIILSVHDLFHEVRMSGNDNTIRLKCSFGKKTTYQSTKSEVAYEILKVEVKEEEDGKKVIGEEPKCPMKNMPFTKGCVEKEGKNCLEYRCSYYDLSCDVGEFICSQYFIDEENKVHRDICRNGFCTAETNRFIVRPPFERIYKKYQYYNKTQSKWLHLVPRCHHIGTDENADTDKKNAELIYSYSLDQEVFVCKDPYMEMDSGYTVNQLIELGILQDTTDDLEVFANLSYKYNKYYDETGVRLLSNEILDDIRQSVIPTSVARISAIGGVSDIDFFEENLSNEGFKRKSYAKYLSSKMISANRNADYPIVKSEYGNLTRDYNTLAFWDYLDCTTAMYLTFDVAGSGLGDDGAALFNAVAASDSDATTTALFSGLINSLKFILMAFPFGILAFAFSVAIGVALILLLARATQQYCVCVLNIVVIIYLSPIIFILFMFDWTKNAKDAWLDDLKKNVLGCCVPFISLSLFLFILDWVMFGDPNKFVEMSMFDANGISKQCYEGHIKEAPIACLSTRMVKEFSWKGALWSLITLGWGTNHKIFELAAFLVLRLLIGIAIFALTAVVSNLLEGQIYTLLGKPDTEVGMGFEQGLVDSYKAGAEFGAKTALAGFKTGITPFVGIFKGIRYIFRR